MSNNKHTPKSRLLVLLLMLSLLISNFIQTPLPVQAANDSVSVTVDSVSADFGSSSSKFKGGVTYARTGYLCYLVEANGGLIDGMKAYAFKCEGFNALGGEHWDLKSKKGNYGTEINSWKGTAPWGYPCFNEDASSNEPQIKKWMTDLDSNNTQQSVQFVYDVWGDTIGEKFKNGDYVLVLENILSFQPATVQKITEADIRSGKYQLGIKMIVNIWGADCRIVAYGHKTNEISEDQVRKTALATGYGSELSKSDPIMFSNRVKASTTAVNNLIKSEVNKAIKDFVGDSSEGIKTGKGSPVIGTLAECIKYETSVGGDPSIFASYTNRVACFSEYIGKGGAGEKAGFKPWTGAIPQKPDKLSDSEVAEYGVGMMVVSAKDAPTDPNLQTTCDEPKQPEPHDPPNESDGEFKIVKSYRIRNTDTNELTDKGTFFREGVDSKITIEDEESWTMIGWKTSTTYDKNIKSTEWESTVPAVQKQQGTDTGTIEMKKPETTLYILFEKTENDPTPVTGNADFIISQSTITRKIKASFPDTGSSTYASGENLLKSINFKYTRPAHSGCSGHTYKYTDGCKDGVEGESCPGHSTTHYCGGWSWKTGEPKEKHEYKRYYKRTTGNAGACSLFGGVHHRRT